MVEAASRIARAVDVPVTADLEAGYGDPVGTAEGAIDAGAVGLNLEDATYRPDDPLVAIDVQAERVRAIRDAGERRGVPLVVNARTDVYLAEVGEPDSRLELVAERARAYRDAGADCVFVPGVRDPDTIRALVAAIDGPVSVLARAGSPSPAELERLGVARVSIGPYAFRATLALLERIGRDLFDSGTYP
jgi:2-methylisocitrate lyase-like PEP mutase family enzyme